MFGVPLSRVLARKDYPSDIPDLVSKCVQYLTNHGKDPSVSMSVTFIGLDVEGIFRISAGASLMEKYKNEFDMCKL